MSWRPTASMGVLRQRADLIDKLRAFFKARALLEVETPLLSSATVTDPHLSSIATQNGSYLQTSPEFAMKRLLAAGSGDIFQISKAFRHEECGQRHRQEFSLLEWYRVGFNHHQLMDEIDELLQQCLRMPAARRLSYQAIFEQHFHLNPHQASCSRLKQVIQAHGIDVVELDDRDDCLNLLFTQLIEPSLVQPTFVYDYPRSQAALAVIKGDIAERFELYSGGIELANGFHELSDAAEQRQRFELDLQRRQQLQLPAVPVDENLLLALAQGLPDCAGVALGIDRLLMAALSLDTIDQAISFANDG